MLKHYVIAIYILLLLSNAGLQGQDGNCPKIKVGIKIAEVYPEVFDHLNREYKSEKSKAVWLAELGALLMKSLRENSPEIEFIYLSADPGADYDYLFTTLIALIGGGEDIEAIQEQTIINGDNFIRVPPLYRSEYIDYYVLSSLIVNSNCSPNRRYILIVEKDKNRDINLAITGNVVKFWRLVNIIEDRENLRPVPPREPAIEIRLEKEYLSVLSEEARKMKIYENVKSCNGKPAFFKSNLSQPVLFPKNTDRGQIMVSDNCSMDPVGPNSQNILVNEAGDAVGEYTLIKGLEAKLEKITLSTCPLGNKPNIEKEVEIIIRGLELKVEPERKVIFNGEQTTITIDLHELDPDGNIFPAAQREVLIEITGLVDGTISHSEKVTTDDMGTAIIEYKAGQKDRQLKITATFTPPGYPEKAKGEGVITVKKPEGDFTGTITYKRSVHWKDESEQPAGNSSMSVDLDENAAVFVAAHYLRTIKEGTDVIELYEANQLTGNCSVVMKKISVVTDHEGTWSKIIDNWQGDKMIEPESGSNLLLSINTTKNTYTLQASIFFAPVDGTIEISSSKGMRSSSDSEPWGVNASLEVEDKIKGSLIIGNWSQPAPNRMAVTPQAGLLPGSTWNWSLSRSKGTNR